MAKERERILVVESDPITGDLIARQALSSKGFEVRVVKEASSAIQEATSFNPDVVIANLDLPGLSGKDLMAALSFQNVHIPVIVVASRGEEKDIIQAFRLGAADFIKSPVRETEVVSAVERALTASRARKERESLAKQLHGANKALEARVDDLTTLFAIGKTVTSITDIKKLFNQIVDGGVKITHANYGWLLILDEQSNEYVLRSQRNLPKSLLEYMNQPWDDGISSLVARSGETLSLSGVAMERFMLYSLGKAAMVVPVKVHEQTIGLLVVMRDSDRSFTSGEQAMLEAVADYAAIALVNLRLFRALDERAASLQAAVESSRQTEKYKDEIVQTVSHELLKPLMAAKGHVDILVSGELGKLSKKQMEALHIAHEKIGEMLHIVDAINILFEASGKRRSTRINMNDLVKNVVTRFSNAANQAKLKLKAEIPQEIVYAAGDADQINIVLDALLSNAIKFSHKTGRVTVKLSRAAKGQASVSVADQGIGISKREINKIFSPFYQVDSSSPRQYGELGIGLTIVQEIINAHGGHLSVESKLEQGSTFSFTLPGGH